MKRSQVGTGNNGTPIWYEYNGENLRTYYDQQVGGNLVAIAVSKDPSDIFMPCFCLPEIWDQGPDVSWVSEDELLKMHQSAASAV